MCIYLRVQGFNSYDGAINVPGNSGSAEQVTDTSAAAAVFIVKAAAQVCTCVHMCARVHILFLYICYFLCTLLFFTLLYSTLLYPTLLYCMQYC